MLGPIRVCDAVADLLLEQMHLGCRVVSHHEDGRPVAWPGRIRPHVDDVAQIQRGLQAVEPCLSERNGVLERRCVVVVDRGRTRRGEA